jgi:predicted ATP-grasp superfamily ATP-dependent carboligase
MTSGPKNTGKRLLLLASKLGYQTRSFAETARKLGVQVFFATDRCERLENPWGDSAIAAHFEKPQEAAAAILEALPELTGDLVEAVLALGERPTVTAAYVARSLHLAGNHPLAVMACRSKLRQKEAFQAAGLPVPWFRAFPLRPAPDAALSGIQFPCVLKPLGLSASQGVIRANDRAEFHAAVERITKLVESAEIASTREPDLGFFLAEGYIPGTEVAVEGLLERGRLRLLAILDKPDPLVGPFFEETIYVTPPQLSEAEQREIERATAEAVRALGLEHGPVHAEFRVNGQGVWPLEVSPRPIGGLCSRALRFAANGAGEEILLEELLVRHALGLPGADWPRERAASGVMMIPVPASGVLQKVEGQEAARATPGITELHITARLQDSIAAWPEGSSYLGFLFARGETPGMVERALREAHAKLRFTIVARLPVMHAKAQRMSAGD